MASNENLQPDQSAMAGEASKSAVGRRGQACGELLAAPSGPKEKKNPLAPMKVLVPAS